MPSFPLRHVKTMQHPPFLDRQSLKIEYVKRVLHTRSSWLQFCIPSFRLEENCSDDDCCYSRTIVEGVIGLRVWFAEAATSLKLPAGVRVHMTPNEVLRESLHLSGIAPSLELMSTLRLLLPAWAGNLHFQKCCQS